MKRFALVVLAMVVLAGCACPRADVNGVVTKNTTNCFLTAQDMICNPSPEVLAGSNILLTLLRPFANAYLPGTAEYNAYITAENIVGVGCATTTGLNGLIAYLQSTQVRSLMATKAGQVKVEAVNVKAFVDWRDKK